MRPTWIRRATAAAVVAALALPMFVGTASATTASTTLWQSNFGGGTAAAMHSIGDGQPSTTWMGRSNVSFATHQGKPAMAVSLPKDVREGVKLQTRFSDLGFAARKSVRLDYDVFVPNAEAMALDLKLPGFGSSPTNQSTWYVSSGGVKHADSASIRIHTRPAGGWSIPHPYIEAYVYAESGGGQTRGDWGMYWRFSERMNAMGSRKGDEFAVPIGEWFTISIEAEMNTPGNADGKLRMWLNGRQGIDINDLVYVTAAPYEWNQTVFSNFYNQGSHPATTMRFANMRFSAATAQAPLPALSVTAPQIALDATGSTASGSYTVETNRATSFERVVLAVRDSAGRVFDFAGFNNVTIDGRRSFSGSRTDLPVGTYTARVAYQLDGQWRQIGDTVTFAVVAPEPVITVPGVSVQVTERTASGSFTIATDRPANFERVLIEARDADGQRFEIARHDNVTLEGSRTFTGTLASMPYGTHTAQVAYLRNGVWHRSGDTVSFEVQLPAPVITSPNIQVSSSGTSASGSFTLTTNRSLFFQRVVLAVRDAAGRVFDFAGFNDVVIDGSRTFSGSRTGLPYGVYTARAAYQFEGQWNQLGDTARFISGPITTIATPVTADFNGDGREQRGWFHNGWWFLPVGPGGDTVVFQYGQSGDRPVTGDFNGSGRDGIGVVRGDNWLLRQTASAGTPELNFRYGLSTDIAVVGDWNNTGRDGIGVFRDGRWLLRQTASAGSAQVSATFGQKGDLPLPGRFTAGKADGFGLVRGDTWLIRTTPTGGSATHTYRFGQTGDRPVVGDWNGSGQETSGVVRGDRWLSSNRFPAGTIDTTVTYAPTSLRPS
jgi:hypothetical protein